METKKLSKLQREVLIGILLGKANLKANTRKTKYSLQILQSDQHKEYVFHLYEIFKNLTTTPPIKFVFQDKRFSGKSYTGWSFNTTNQACFRFYAHQFYRNERKVVPKLISKWLSPRAIAYWYMDDGDQKWKDKSLGVRFCTDNFILSEINTLIEILQKKYQLKCGKQKKDDKFRIYISRDSYVPLTNLVSPFFIPSMIYKFPKTQV